MVIITINIPTDWCTPVGNPHHSTEVTITLRDEKQTKLRLLHNHGSIYLFFELVDRNWLIISCAAVQLFFELACLALSESGSHFEATLFFELLDYNCPTISCTVVELFFELVDWNCPTITFGSGSYCGVTFFRTCRVVVFRQTNLFDAPLNSRDLHTT